MRKALAILLTLAMLGVTVGSVAAETASFQAAATPKPGCTYYEETGHNLCAGFRAYWERYGGLAIFGFPITDEFVQNGMTVQYFERARFEWHPGAWPERYDVLLGLLGVADAEQHGLLATPPFQRAQPCANAMDYTGGWAGSGSGCTYFQATGHNLSAGFRDYWNAYGGLAIFGYPISEEFVHDGMTVQYFERARFEWHPGAWPARWDVLLGLLGSELVQENDQIAMTVIASGLNNPRHIKIGPDGAVYVAEAGTTGDNCIEIPGEGEEEPVEICFGTTGVVTKIAGGQQSHAATGLPSLTLGGEGGEQVGVHDVAFGADGTLYGLIGLGADPAERAMLGDFAAPFGTLVRFNDDGSWTSVVDVAAYEGTNNPEPTLIDSNPYALLRDGDKWIVADAGANALLQVAADGTISTLAVFPAQMVDAPPFLGEPEGTQIPSESVPTSVVKGPDGAYYVGELTGFPFPVGGARVWRVMPGEAPTVYATGFTNIGDIAFDAQGNLYVLEITANGLLAAEMATPEDPTAAEGQLIKVMSGGGRTTVARSGLIFSTGLAIGSDGAIYVSNFGIMPGMGQVVRIVR